MIGTEVNIIKVIEEALRIETCHMTEVEAGIEIIKEALVGIEDRGSGNRNRSNCGDKSEERRCHYCRESGHFISECQ